jgi:predicted transcriptional regulator YdeE
MFNGTGSSHYLSGVEVSESSVLPAQFSRVQIPAERYVIFPHREHVSRLRHTVNAIWFQWLPESGHQAARAAAAPDFFDATAKTLIHSSDWATSRSGYR